MDPSRRAILASLFSAPVALKLLPSDVADEGERLARFRREAKLLAALNHPNVASLYGFEETDEHRFLVMEVVEGEELDDLIRPGVISESRAVEIATGLGVEELLERCSGKDRFGVGRLQPLADGRVREVGVHDARERGHGIRARRPAGRRHHDGLVPLHDLRHVAEVAVATEVLLEAGVGHGRLG